MGIPFETAALSIAFGASVSVLVQGRLLDRRDARDLPPRVALALQAFDGLLAAAFLIPGLVAPGVSLSAEMVRIVLVGLVVVGPCVAAPVVVSWRSRRHMRRVRARADDWRLERQTVRCALTDGGESTARIFVGAIDGHDACWLDTREADRLVRIVAEARRAAIRRGDDPASPERWFWSGGLLPRLLVRYDGRLVGRSDRSWCCADGEPFVDGAGLLGALGARMPLSARATS